MQDKEIQEALQEVARMIEEERYQKKLEHIATAPLEVLEAEDRERAAQEAFERWLHET